MKINSVTLTTSKLAALRSFYADTLGLPLCLDEAQRFAVVIGQSTLCFEHSPEAASYHLAFNIPENQLEAGLLWLQQQGVSALDFEQNIIIDFPNWNAHALYFVDPAGNVLELIARHDLDNAQTKAFSADSLLNISEVGLPCPDVGQLYAWLSDFCRVPVYSHISNMTKFCAAGDPQGLFIIVPLERPWFPTSVLNGLYPLRVTIEGTEAVKAMPPGLPYQFELLAPAQK
ncbi:VOC family protein [Eisenibacter elegans]|jgi:catechol-2,3-dioxygenase|uniref:VOC family protein n=1 Tax=Eisenibacter elegans TaxID=997 RepID=UPI000684CD4D|nr:hypothetical protein [Eisenibacter elegans]